MGSHEDHEEHGQDHEHGESHEHGDLGPGEHGDHHGNDEHIHIHVHGGHPKGRDFFHRNPIPGAHSIDVDYVHGICQFHAGSIELSGNIYMRQDFLGQGPVEMQFEIDGFHSGHAHAHHFTVNRYGDTAGGCGGVGDVFTPPHRLPSARGRNALPGGGRRDGPGGPGGRPGGGPGGRPGGG